MAHGPFSGRERRCGAARLSFWQTSEVCQNGVPKGKLASTNLGQYGEQADEQEGTQGDPRLYLVIPLDILLLQAFAPQPP